MRCIPIESIGKESRSIVSMPKTEQLSIFNKFPFEILAYIADIFVLLLT